MPKIPLRYFLYAEDDQDDQALFREIVRDIDPDIEVVICGHGLELMQFLEALAPGDALPCCIVLDINMPLWDGIRTLQTLKSHAAFQAVTVVMFTTSRAQREAERSKQLGATSFLTKPITKKDFVALTEEFSILCSGEPARKV